MCAKKDKQSLVVMGRSRREKKCTYRSNSNLNRDGGKE
jgi:hypothetical protein